MARQHRNKSWKLSGREADGVSYSVLQSDKHLATLMDIREQLYVLNRVLARVPTVLTRVARNTAKPRKRA